MSCRLYCWWWENWLRALLEPLRSALIYNPTRQEWVYGHWTGMWGGRHWSMPGAMSVPVYRHRPRLFLHCYSYSCQQLIGLNGEYFEGTFTPASRRTVPTRRRRGLGSSCPENVVVFGILESLFNIAVWFSGKFDVDSFLRRFTVGIEGLLTVFDWEFCTWSE